MSFQDFHLGLHENMQMPAIVMDGQSLTLENYKQRMNMRDNIAYTAADCLVFAVGSVDKARFGYELEVAQTIPHHLVVLMAEQESNWQITGWQSTKFFATPFMISGAKVRAATLDWTSVQFLVNNPPAHLKCCPP